MDKPIRFERTFNLGHVITVLGFILSVATLIWFQSKWQANVDTHMLTLEAVQAEAKVAGKEARDKYIPLIETLGRSDDVQNDRIKMIGEALQEIRKSQSEIVTKVNELTVGIAEIRAQQKLDGTRERTNQLESEPERLGLMEGGNGS